MKDPEQLRWLVKISGALGLLLMLIGFFALPQRAEAYRAPALLAFYGGLALLLASIILWYRYVPPRPPAPEEPEEFAQDDESD
jgi:hypothetical protein